MRETSEVILHWFEFVSAAAVVKGDTPLLISQPELKKLVAQLDFANDHSVLFNGAKTMNLETNSAGRTVTLQFATGRPAKRQRRRLQRKRAERQRWWITCCCA